MSEHPSLDDIALFVEGRSPDPSRIEKHIDHCPDCASEVLHGRELRYTPASEIPRALTAEQQTAKARLVQDFVKRTGRFASTPSPGSAAPEASKKPSGSGERAAGMFGLGAGLGALAEWWTHGLPTSSPALAESHDTPPPASEHDSHALPGLLQHGAHGPQEDTAKHSGESAATHGTGDGSHATGSHAPGSPGLETFLAKAHTMFQDHHGNAHDPGHVADGHSETGDDAQVHHGHEGDHGHDTEHHDLHSNDAPDGDDQHSGHDSHDDHGGHHDDHQDEHTADQDDVSHDDTPTVDDD
jgi:hypothetical protein